MFSSKLFTAVSLLAFIILVATLVIQLIEMKTYEMF